MFDQDQPGFDAVVMNNNCGNPIADPQRRANLLEFVRRGKGLVGIHCAAHLDWPEYTEMLGAYSISHPWNAGSTVVIRVEEPDHPLAGCFAASSFPHTDEIFLFRDFSQAGPRPAPFRQRATDMNKPGAPTAWRLSAVVRRQGQPGLTCVSHQQDAYWRRRSWRITSPGFTCHGDRRPKSRAPSTILEGTDRGRRSDEPSQVDVLAFVAVIPVPRQKQQAARLSPGQSGTDNDNPPSHTRSTPGLPVLPGRLGGPDPITPGVMS